MADLTEGVCKACGAKVLWCVTAEGRNMPLDPLVRSILVDRGDGRYRVMQGRESHFATCPRASDMRRARR